MRNKHIVLFMLGFLMMVISIWQIAATQSGLDVINLHTTNPPVTMITPSNAVPASRPTILIAHGFAGSEVLMRGFALTLAHAGYTTVSWDFEGHGANPNPLIQSSESNDLLQNAQAALAEAETTGLINTQLVAILGHSMGSGVALSYGITHPDTYATIAISPVSQSVSPTLPHNLLLMAGSLEPQFVSSAERLLAMAGGQSNDLAAGSAHKLVIIPNVEHISILFSPTAHSTSRSWLDATFGPQPEASNYTDRRILWFGLGIIGSIFLSKATLSTFPATIREKVLIAPQWLRIIALLGGSLIATIFLWLVSLGGVKLSQLLGLLVGGYMLIWYGVAGVISLLILRPHLSRPSTRELFKGLIAFAALWLGVGLLGNFVWLPWLLIPSRLWLWIPGTIILLPWFFSVGEAARQANRIGQIGWWLIQVMAVVGGLYLALRINPELGFLFIILPLVPVIIGLHMLAISPKHGTWAFAMSGAMFTAWLLLAVFPLQ
ncbi:MAG: alpha/beta fold hydrolase [Anaerolineales bacterium]